ncbi:outer membrane beta-barrel protein [Pedobacter psychroterrae]|uniref:Uncharacterized protein n=1 Tax=Pedobacter psychroterrae TaxID=2530453 RepID=A0A4R0NE42_9SPHI|nr:autotransporter domain-containing protein [Pedobacter psychroterrae]TCC97392.1 hypothetical protein EZ437_20100 [Pedobacter psychroterrae]
MKRQLLTAMAVVLSVCGYAQTKGTNALGFGVNFSTTKSEQNTTGSGHESKNKIATFQLGYGHFIADNSKLGFNVLYGKTEVQNSGYENNAEGERVSVALDYQHYYPLIKKLYAFAGGNVGYGTYDYTSTSNDNQHDYRTNDYFLGAQGGLTWFFSKTFALETSLINANFGYSEVKSTNQGPNNNTVQSSTNFNINTQGQFTNLNFRIYLMF